MSSKGAEEMLLKEKVVLHLFDLLLLLCTVYIYFFSHLLRFDVPSLIRENAPDVKNIPATSHLQQYSARTVVFCLSG